MPDEPAPLPISKPTRVVLEAVRTAAAVLAVVVNVAVLLRVYGIV